jgi:hypothetical protein
MDSEYFFRVDPDAREVDLRELPEEPLIRVLHSLYGAQLILSSVGELREVYPIILYLGTCSPTQELRITSRISSPRSSNARKY